MYNFGVEQTRSYFVGETGAWVHNCWTDEEKRFVDYLQNLNIPVKKNPLEGVEGAGRQGDALIGGVVHESKTIEGAGNSANIRNAIGRSLKNGGQARNLVVDVRGTGMSKAEAERGIARSKGLRGGKAVDHIRVIGDDFFTGC